MNGDAPGSHPRPLGRAVLYLAALGAFFYLSYGLSNWLASLRSDVPSIVFGWERSIPFLSWTIIPYWTTNILYAGSLLLARTRAELDRQAKVLLTAQLVAVSFFVLTPLKFSWGKPETGGFLGYFYDALGSFDQPFNQAPSLHVALTVNFVAFYARLLPRRVFAFFLAWSALVMVSTLTTWQHHFIDLPTGALLGLVCVWLWREDASCRLSSWALTREPRRRVLAMRYAIAAILFALVGILFKGGWLWLFWPAFALGAVAFAYLGFGPELFAKSSDGRVAWPARIALAPYMTGAWLSSRWFTRHDPKTIEIADGVHLGRFPSAADLAQFKSVVDLTSELSRPRFDGRWTAIPMLDLVAPGVERLQRAVEAIESARREGPTLACCALGYGRSVASLAVWLVLTKHAATMEDALALLKKKRDGMVLKEDQLQCVAEAIDARA